MLNLSIDLDLYQEMRKRRYLNLLNQIEDYDFSLNLDLMYTKTSAAALKHLFPILVPGGI